MIIFLKSHVAGYTRSDGAYVSPHEDKRTKKTHSYTYHLEHNGKAKPVHGMIDAHDHDDVKRLVKENLSDDEKSRFLGIDVHGETPTASSRTVRRG